MRTIIILLFATLIVALSFGQERKQKHITVLPIPAGNVTTFGISADNAGYGDQAVIDVCYWTSLPVGFGNTKIVRCSTNVVSLFKNLMSASETVPVGLDAIQSVRIRIVRILDEERFTYRETQP